MWFDMPGVDEAASERIFLANLADVVANYRDAGVEHLVMAEAVADRRSLDLIASTIVVPLSVVLLKVPIDVIDGRLQADPTDARRNDLRTAERWLVDDTGTGFEDFTVDNTGPIDRVADTIIGALGWVPGTSSDR